VWSSFSQAPGSARHALHSRPRQSNLSAISSRIASATKAIMEIRRVRRARWGHKLQLAAPQTLTVYAIRDTPDQMVRPVWPARQANTRMCSALKPAQVHIGFRSVRAGALSWLSSI
jgi:hypothetical protein